MRVRHAPRPLVPAGDNELFRRMSAIAQPGYVDESVPRHPARAVMDLKQSLGPETRVVAPPGDAGLWVARTFPTDRMGSVVVPAYDRPGIAAAVALVSAARGTDTVCVVTDPIDAVTAELRSIATRHDLPVRFEMWGDDVDWSRTEDLVAAAGPVVAWTRERRGRTEARRRGHRRVERHRTRRSRSRSARSAGRSRSAPAGSTPSPRPPSSSRSRAASRCSHVLDVTDPASVDEFFTAAEAVFGPVDALVNNAGIAVPGLLVDADPAGLAREIDTNLLGPLLCTRRVLPAMLDAGRGDVVFVSSDTARLPRPGMIGYSASKAAIETVARVVDMETEGRGIRTTVVRVGPTLTDFAGDWTPGTFEHLARALAPLRDPAPLQHRRAGRHRRASWSTPSPPPPTPASTRSRSSRWRPSAAGRITRRRPGGTLSPTSSHERSPAMQRDDMIIVSVDDHVVEPPNMFDAHLPAKYADIAPKLIRKDDGTDVWRFQTIEVPNIGLNAVAGRPEGGVRDRPDLLRRDPLRLLQRRRPRDGHERERHPRLAELPEPPRVRRPALRHARGQGHRQGPRPGVQRLAHRRVVRVRARSGSSRSPSR